MQHNPRNPLLEVPEAISDEQKAKIEFVKKQAEEWQRLCYETFHVNQNGKKIYEMLKEHHLNLAIDFNHSNCDKHALRYIANWESIQNLYNHGLMHLKRINEGNQ